MCGMRDSVSQILGVSQHRVWCSPIPVATLIKVLPGFPFFFYFIFFFNDALELYPAAWNLWSLFFSSVILTQAPWCTLGSPRERWLYESRKSSEGLSSTRTFSGGTVGQPFQGFCETGPMETHHTKARSHACASVGRGLGSSLQGARCPHPAKVPRHPAVVKPLTVPSRLCSPSLTMKLLGFFLLFFLMLFNTNW